MRPWAATALLTTATMLVACGSGSGRNAATPTWEEGDATTTASSAPVASRDPLRTTPSRSPTRQPAATSTAAPRPTFSYGKVTGPQDATVALRAYEYTNILVADLTTGDVYTLLAAQYACWVDDNTLLAGDRVYVLDDASAMPAVDPSIACSGLPENRVIPRAGGRVWENPEGLTSADGLWTLVQDVPTSHIVGPGGRTIPVPSTGTFSWSPTGHKLAIGGGWCGYEPPLQFIDPDAGDAPAGTDYGGRSLVYMWHPDSSGVIAGIAYDSTPSLSFVRASDAEPTRLFPDPPVDNISPIIPMSVSPSGTRVLFYLYIHRPCS